MAAHKPFAEFDDFVFAFVNRLHPDSVGGTAILLAYDYVLRHVNQFARHVTRVSGLESGIGQTFTRAVGGDEVFQYREAFAEVRQNRFFDDVAGGFGHEAADAGELTNLLAIATSPRVH